MHFISFFLIIIVHHKFHNLNRYYTFRIRLICIQFYILINHRYEAIQLKQVLVIFQILVSIFYTRHPILLFGFSSTFWKYLKECIKLEKVRIYRFCEKVTIQDPKLPNWNNYASCLECVNYKYIVDCISSEFLSQRVREAESPRLITVLSKVLYSCRSIPVRELSQLPIATTFDSV